jgi:hypothetical protein
MAMSDGLANKLLGHLIGVTFTPDPLYLALYKDDGTEVVRGSYARIDITGSLEVNTDTLSNSAQINFPTATADWGTITEVKIFSAASAGDEYFFGATQTSRNISAGETYTILVGNFSIKLD